MRVLLALLLPAFFLSAATDELPKNTRNVQFLLGYPRSGNNWTMAILQITAHKPISWLTGRERVYSIALNPLNLPIDHSKSLLYRNHYLTPSLYQINHSKNKLIFIMRNYKECIVRHGQYSPEQLRDSVLNFTGGFRHYIELLVFFDKEWRDKSTKHLIYYEELIKKPRPTVEKLLIFLHEKTDHVDDLFDNFEYWRELVINKYHEIYPEIPSSGGDKEIFHTKDFPVALLKEIDNQIKMAYPALWKKYLSVYETK